MSKGWIELSYDYYWGKTFPKKGQGFVWRAGTQGYGWEIWLFRGDGEGRVSWDSGAADTPGEAKEIVDGMFELVEEWDE